MNEWLFFALAAAVVFLLYRRGFGVTKRIRALLFVFRPGKDGDLAELDACTGWVQHAGRFRESGTYELLLDAPLSRGEARASLLDGKKRPLLELSRHTPSGRIELEGNRRYYLRWEFHGAAGRCSLRWRLQAPGETSDL